MKTKPHKKSCWNCENRWYNEHSPGEVTNIGKEGHVCDGHKNSGVANLRSFPFRTEQPCYKQKR